MEARLQAEEENVTRLGDIVRAKKALLKDGKGSKAEVDAAIEELKNSKLNLEKVTKEYQAANGTTSLASKEQFRAAVSNTLERKMFYVPSFKIYGSVAGFYDYGPPGCSVKANITQFWRQHFVLEENMLEVECPAVTPEIVLKASGHVAKFVDFMVEDVVTKDGFRADHLLKAALEQILEDNKSGKQKRSREELVEIDNVLAKLDEYKAEELGQQLTKYEVKAPETKNDITAPYPFNLMFKTNIGPRGDNIGYLRPETAQGIFVNFKDLLYYNGGNLPFAAAQIGQSFRNEISPRQGLLRVREFTQAEIEHFCIPEQKIYEPSCNMPYHLKIVQELLVKDHPKFSSVADLKPLLFSQDLQEGEEKVAKPMSLGEAVSQNIIANETLGYFIGRTYLFLEAIGIDVKRLRFRQHLAKEMAHYALDCWDAEIQCSYGWIECVGLADRSAYDLNAHAEKSKIEMTARENFDKPRQVEVVVIKPNKQALGKAFKQKAKDVQATLENLCDEPALKLKAELESGKGSLKVEFKSKKEGEDSKIIGEETFELTSDMVSISKQSKTQNGRTFTPSVVEPSFGIGRIMYCMFEHCYYVREQDAQRTVFKFTPLVAPTKATVFPLLKKAEMTSKAEEVSQLLRKAGVSNLLDTTGTTVGKRYARTDEIGVPFGVTVDAQTLQDKTVTLRERDSTKQIRITIDELPKILRKLSKMELSWQDLLGQGYQELQNVSES